MEYRLRHLPPAAWRIVRSRAGDQLDEGLRRLIEWWAAGEIDPLSEDTPAAQLARRGGEGRAAALDPDERSAISRAAARARWAREKE